jgi:hypothetical protein
MLIKIYNFTVPYYFEDNERKTRRRDAPPVFLAIIADSSSISGLLKLQVPSHKYCFRLPLL